jgi:hypothetical protein
MNLGILNPWQKPFMRHTNYVKILIFHILFENQTKAMENPFEISGVPTKGPKLYIDHLDSLIQLRIEM